MASKIFTLFLEPGDVWEVLISNARDEEAVLMEM